MARLGLFLALSLALVCLVAADSCSRFNLCGTCAGSTIGTEVCRWCDGTSECVSSRSTCQYGLVVTTPLQCQSSNVCNRHNDCSSCQYQANCGWCATEGRCMEGQSDGPHTGYCRASSWRWGSCNSRTPHLGALWIVLGVGIAVTIIGFTIVICVRRARQRASNDSIELSLASSAHDDGMFASSASSEPQITTALPGYMYTTTSASPNLPSYVYTAVPIGPVVSSIPNQ